MTDDMNITGAFRAGTPGERLTFGDPYRGEVIRRLQAVLELTGYWMPIGKLIESLAYTDASLPEEYRRQGDQVVKFLLGGPS